MNNWADCSAVEQDLRKVSGVWVFRGTRVPVSALFENLEDGAQLADFIDWFPGVTLQQVRAVLEHVANTLEAVPYMR
ncbi:DUF433 domain-containing protein [Candidatus Thiosymbion oneisti]|uniref:DUF433 domain-containing protein n=1 Tax=Candidatus Thiosymbion oneisti TaxID=589554 RepID=UPI0010613F30|nr:DUF433 domain-containing protein [Candidatus Thiosymbion oneisti]